MILRLPCYEPSGLTLELGVGDILRHVLVVGMTGAGKSTLLNHIWSDLIHYRSAGTGQRAGLLILDSQGDHTVHHIRELAAHAGRADEVRVLSPDEGFINPMAQLTSFASIETVSSQIVAASNFNDTNLDNRDAFWTENMRHAIEAGLTYLLIHRSKNETLKTFQFLTDLFLSTEWSKETKGVMEWCEKVIASSGHLSAGIRAKLALARNTITSWQKMDSRTKCILQSCLTITLSPFLAASALRYWDVTKGNQVRASEALDGKIVIVSTRAATEVETASLICRLIKMEFYGKAQERRSLGKNHVAGIVMDEFHYAVTTGSRRWSDISNLATLRGKGIFVVAATQGLIQLDLILGVGSTEALLINFSNLILMRSQETGHLYAVAERIFGQKPPRVFPGYRFDDRPLVIPSYPFALPPEPVCPPGALARLETHQAFVQLANGYKTSEPVWLAPLFLPEPEAISISEVDVDLQALRRADLELKPATWSKTSARTFYSLRLWKFLIDAAPKEVRALQTLTLDEFRKALEHMGHHPDGLKTVPAGWRLACLRLASKLSESLRITRLASANGVLDVAIAGTSHRDLLPIFRLEARWRHSVYPTRLRPLSVRDQRWLATNFPHLRTEISPTEKFLP